MSLLEHVEKYRDACKRQLKTAKKKQDGMAWAYTKGKIEAYEHIIYLTLDQSLPPWNEGGDGTSEAPERTPHE